MDSREGEERRAGEDDGEDEIYDRTMVKRRTISPSSTLLTSPGPPRGTSTTTFHDFFISHDAARIAVHHAWGTQRDV